MKYTVLAAATALLLMITGCSGGGSAAPDIDPEQAAQSILNAVEFQDSLVRMEDVALEDIYFLDNTVTSCAVYVSGSGATAEEVAVLQVGDKKDVENARILLEKRVENLIFRFEDYRPDEMQKLKNPVIAEIGNSVILILSDNNEAAEAAINALKNGG